MTNWKDNPSIRRSQTITPFGVGSIYEWSGQSFVACDTYLWKKAGEPLELKRLSDELGISGFRQAPEAPKYGDTTHKIPFMRFPKWHFCPKCRVMKEITPSNNSSEAPRCHSCRNQKLSAMRWVIACKQGHLSDVDWRRWAHRGDNPDNCVSTECTLTYIVKGGSTYDAIAIHADCGAKQSLEHLMKPKFAGKCEGKQPWIWGNHFGKCDSDTQVVLKGGSNIHYSRTVSALDIPPASNYRRPGNTDDQKLHDLYIDNKYKQLSQQESAFSEDGEPKVVTEHGCEKLAHRHQLEKDTVISLLFNDWSEYWDINPQNNMTIGITDSSNLKVSEFKAFLTRDQEFDERDNFIIEHTTLNTESADNQPTITSKLQELIPSVVLAKRLREVRSLTGFTRLVPGGEDVAVLEPDLGRIKKGKWLPAMESFGEGIFLEFNEEILRRWESNEAVLKHVEKTRERCEEAGAVWLPSATPRFISLHTFAHGLIRQLTFDCGYPSSSLRERIYAQTSSEGEAMAGILIYTASGDTEGSLGGLVRQGKAPRLIKTISQTIENLLWCSSDPVCSELKTGLGGINSGACHACSLVSETSCEYSNLLLDRQLLIGSSTNEEMSGFLENITSLLFGRL